MITICVPTYNASAFVSDAIESILKQDFQNFKVVLVDDASTDTTVDILERYCVQDSRFELKRHSQNSGACGLAIQEVLASCTTDYFMWFGADDELTPHYLSTLIDILEKTNVGYAYSDFEIIDENGTPTKLWRFPYSDLPTYIHRVLMSLSGGLPMNGVFKVSHLRELGLEWLLYNGESRSSDTINGMYFRGQGLRIVRYEQPIFKYRIHRTNLSHDLTRRSTSDRNVIDFIFENFPDIVDIFAKGDISTFRAECYARCTRRSLL